MEGIGKPVSNPPLTPTVEVRLLRGWADAPEAEPARPRPRRGQPKPRTARLEGATRAVPHRRKPTNSRTPLTASRAELLHRLGRITEARLAYQEALLLAENTVERDFLATRLSQLPG